ncbi:uncharacterized protein BDR25DRAFT_161827, partial [Lindgomyces ingoldianus]
WLPNTLRWGFIWLPLALSFSLSLVISMMCWYSQKHSGLGKVDGSSVLLFGWRFTPTIIAVLYNQLTVMLFDDIRRTEPFARLAKPGGAGALPTLLQAPTFWWTALIEGSRKKDGRRSWLLILGTLVNVFAFLIISPLSSALLAPDNVRLPQPVGFARTELKQDAVLPVHLERDTYFRTLGNVLQNVTTSPWITDRYTVLPFWPTSSNHFVSSSRLPPTGQTWEVEGIVFSIDFNCQHLDMVTFSDHSNRTIFPFLGNISVTMESVDGCRIDLSSPASALSLTGGSFWADLSSFPDVIRSMLELTGPASVNVSTNCTGNEVLYVSDTWDSTSPANAFQQSALNVHVCMSSYYSTVLPVTVANSGAEVTIQFNEQEFLKKRQLVTNGIDVAGLQKAYIDPSWSSYMPSLSIDSTRILTKFIGVSKVLAAQHRFNASQMARAADIPEQAARLRRRFFSEVMQSSVAQSDAATTQNAAGHVIMGQRRIVVVKEAAIILGFVFAVSFFFLVAICWLSRTRVRPTNLTQDPGSVLGIASLVALGREPLQGLKDLDQSSQKVMKKALQERRYFSTPGQLHVDDKPGQEMSSGTRTDTCISTSSPNWRPTVLRLRSFFALGFYVLCLIVGVAVLQHFANRSSGLYQSAFVFQANLPGLNQNLGTIAPFSIIPTLMAIAVGLWWEGLDKSFRTLQPYFAMSNSKSPVRVSRGFGLSYQSSYWLFATCKALLNSHWILALVTLGTFLSQAFIISMSALFERDTSAFVQSIILNRTIGLRQIPYIQTEDVRNVPGQTYANNILKDLFTNLTTNWMYGAVIHMTLNGSEPAWSHEGWSFVPIDLAGVTNDHPKQHLGYQTNDEKLAASISPVNVTVSTPAIRGRVECTPVEEARDHSSWLNTEDLTKDPWVSIRTELTTGYSLKPIMFPNREYNTSVLTSKTWVQCCNNDTTKDKDLAVPVSIGYWSTNDPESYPHVNQTWPRNFTAKWIRGQARHYYIPSEDGTEFQITWKRDESNGMPHNSPFLIFTSLPSIQILNCVPIIETANAEVVVAQKSGRIQSYNILDTPKSAPEAWFDAFVVHNVTDPSESKPFSNDTVFTEKVGSRNITASYGILFLSSLLGAGDMYNFQDSTMAIRNERFSDSVFNIRANGSGLNTDFMSYAAYAQAGKDAQAMLDPETFLKGTQRAFSTFFQYYVSTDTNLVEGGWAFQPRHLQPPDLGKPIDPTKIRISEEVTIAVNKREAKISDSDTAISQVSTEVSTLRMNHIATWMAVGILIWLLITTLTVSLTLCTYLKSLVRGVECVADVLALIAGSQRLLDLVKERGSEELMRDKDLRMKLGWFRDLDGRIRWGVEVV